MALDVTLCIVPAQIETVFVKAQADAAYADWVDTIPQLLANPDYPDFGEPGLLRLKADVQAWQPFFTFTAADSFYDQARVTATLDYLLAQYCQAHTLPEQASVIWAGGEIISPSLAGGQGVPLRCYRPAQIQQVNRLLAPLQARELLPFYEVTAMQAAGVYKLVPPTCLAEVSATFTRLQALFNRASANSNRWLLQVID
jgi:hypothetical protein